MYYVYILFSTKDNKFYIGYTSNLLKRVVQHRDGQVTSTKNRLPIYLVCYEAYNNKTDALVREKYVKSSNGRRELKIRLKLTIESILLS